MGSLNMSLNQIATYTLLLLFPGFGLHPEGVSGHSSGFTVSKLGNNPPRSSHLSGRRVVRRRKVNHDKTRDNDNVIIVENFDKLTLSELLERKEKKVGEVVLVNGKPAIIKKRKLGNAKRPGLKIKKVQPIKNLQKIRVRRVEEKNQFGLPKRMKISFPISLKRKVLRKKVELV